VAPQNTGFLPRLPVGLNPEPKATTIHPRVEPVALWFMGKAVHTIRNNHQNKITNLGQG